MSQRAMLAALDQQLHAAFASAGMADPGLYAAPDAPGDGEPEPCSVYVDRDMQTLGETRQFKAGRVEVVYVLSSMSAPPVKRGRLLVDGSAYTNDTEISNDGSLSRWVVTRG